MRKRKLILDNEVEDTVFGLVSSLKEFKLAWEINEKFNIELARQPELKLSFINSPDLVITKYEYLNDVSSFKVLKNRALNNQGSYLIPELTRFDYFVLLDEPDFYEGSTGVLEKLKSIAGIDFAVLIETEKLKSKDNFIF